MTKALKPGWRWVKFGDVVRLNKDRSADPLKEGIERYVGLEHLEPGDLRVRSWGNVADGTTFTNYFQPGQVLFGKRRAYQRKVAVADFSGVCSGDIYVLESSNASVLLPDLLPFICQTDAFFEHAVGTSAGSLSPRTNWNSLARYEFALPPLEEQRKIAHYLGAMRNVLDKYDRLQWCFDKTMKASLMHLVIGGQHDKSAPRQLIEDVRLKDGWTLRTAKEICDAPVISGRTPQRTYRTEEDTGFPFIRVQNLTFSGILDFNSNPEFVTKGLINETKSLLVKPNDILINIVGPPMGKVSIVPSNFAESLINQAIVRFRVEKSNMRFFLFAYLMSDWAQQWLLSRSTKTSGQRNINTSTCASLPVPVPPIASSIKSLCR